jgi:hypothetical protein
MSVIAALVRAAEDEFFRGLQGSDRGILRAIGRRSHDALTGEDYEFATKLLGLMLTREWDTITRGRESDDAFERRATELAEAHSEPELRRKLSSITWREDADGRGGRSSSAAVNNEGHRYQWEHNRLIERAIQIRAGATGGQP